MLKRKSGQISCRLIFSLLAIVLVAATLLQGIALGTGEVSTPVTPVSSHVDRISEGPVAPSSSVIIPSTGSIEGSSSLQTAEITPTAGSIEGSSSLSITTISPTTGTIIGSSSLSSETITPTFGTLNGSITFVSPAIDALNTTTNNVTPSSTTVVPILGEASVVSTQAGLQGATSTVIPILGTGQVAPVESVLQPISYTVDPILGGGSSPSAGVDPNKSTVEVIPMTLPADGTTTATITVTLRDGTGALITDGRDVAVTSNRTEDTVTPVAGYESGRSDINGVFKATIASVLVGDATITTKVDEDKIELNLHAVISFYPVLHPQQLELRVPIYSPYKQSAHPGTVLEFMVALTNHGTNSDTIEFTAIDEGGWESRCWPDSVILASDEQTQFNVYVKVGEDGSMHNIRVQAQSAIMGSEPASCIVQARKTPFSGTGLFSTTLWFANQSDFPDRLIFNVPGHAKIPSQYIAGRYIELAPHTSNSSLSIMFDPTSSWNLDLYANWISVESESTGDLETVYVDFTRLDTLISTEFDMAKDSYSFSNAMPGYFCSGYDGGYCGGMAFTSALYSMDLVSLPSNQANNTYELTLGDAMDNIALYQWGSPLPSFSSNDSDTYHTLVMDALTLGKPIILSLGGEVHGKDNHSVVAYKVVENTSQQKSFILVYDPNHPYISNFGWGQEEAFSYVVYDQTQGRFLHYFTGALEYTKFEVAFPFTLGTAGEKIARANGHLGECVTSAGTTIGKLVVRIKCPVHVLATDQFGRVIDSQGNNEIPEACFEAIGPEKYFYLPEELSYNLDINAYSTGEFNLTFVSQITENSTLMVHFPDVSITDSTNIQLSIEPDINNYVMRIDYDGDGVSDEMLSPSVCETFGGNHPPKPDTGGPYIGYEGSVIFLNASNSYDQDGDSLSYRWDLDGDGTWDTDWSSNAIVGKTFSDDCLSVVRLLVSDGELTASSLSAITISNALPTVFAVVAPVNPVAVNTLVSASASFTDPGMLDTHTVAWDWGDSSTSIGIVTETGGSGTVGGNHTYTKAGVYTVTLTVADDDGGSAQSVFQYVVVYDPSAGFVTGGGWINSPLGAYMPAPSLAGKATFGFVSKYQKGANVPTGNTQFQFHAANMDFKSTSYQWLVISGARAQYKGSGTINGAGDYGFLLTAIDGQINGGGGADKFRIKIWDKATGNTVYDNQMGASDTDNPTTVIAGGSIVIHK